ncbi:M1 family metallopeptidase [Spirillospora sp. NBC_01491]|uniref:M1 family metallopeptidase n=1 Tax=Spirillospora sp. NBC_01491 TaxID=2976007 RepID=UPI002E33746D|nr:M1 family metallopeptidase [Spirillospora sp. NBC_01491]
MNGPYRRVTAVATAAALLASANGVSAAADSPRPAGPPRPVSPLLPIPAPRPAASAPPARPGSAGIGDAYYPRAGNGGYDVAHYDVALTYAGRKTGKVDATVTINARATRALSRFDLDFRGPKIKAVRVGGRPAAYRRKGQELIITPAAALPKGRSFSTTVRYAGRPGPVRNESLGTYGWVPTKDGAVVVAEPDGAPTWLPVNDHPRDKATYAFHLTVPKNLRALANGRPVRTVRRGARTTYEWAETSPMASYLATVAIGRFQVRRSRAGNVPVITAVDPRFKRAAASLHANTVKAVRWGTKMFGPYPFATAGGIVDDPKLDYALETQERPVYGGFVPDDNIIVHEIAHQWFGDSVSLHDWRDIWLNEGFATYAEWLWHEQGRGGTRKPDPAKDIFRRYARHPAASPVYTPPPGRPKRRDLFGFSVYVRGAMCLQALREKIGDRAFFEILRTWAPARKDGSATTPQFIAFAEKVSGERLGPLFTTWLYTKGKPRTP